MRGNTVWGVGCVIALTLAGAGCSGGSDTNKTTPKPGSGSVVPTTKASSPVSRAAFPGLGQVAKAGDWQVSVSALTPTDATAAARSLPAQSMPLRATVTLTNTANHIASVPTTVVTARYGALGRTATAFTDTHLPGLPKPSSSTSRARVLPGGVFTADIGIAVPARASGESVTVTTEVTEEGMVNGENVFFEGRLPGTPQDAPEPVPGSGPPPTGAVLPLGAWSQHGYRVGPLRLEATPATDGRRTASLDLSYDNKGTSTRSGLGRSLSVLTGPDLTEADEVRAWLDYHDAPIAPGRIATVTVSVTLPENAIPGPVTVELIGGSGLERTPYTGTLN
ncbi:hypothetical protein [Embleya sp. NPDC005575]|uniref:hypothetical protein n=1 Tax=Embleya sp. NPDC005575 TaxID=3156892 RepID=UPI0033BB7D69